MPQPHRFIDDVRHRAGLADWSEAERLATHVLHALRPLLRADERREFASRLPAPLASTLQAEGNTPPDDDVDHLYERVAHTTHVPLARAVEEARIVCAALAALLTPDEHQRWRRDQPPAIAELFTVRESVGAIPAAGSSVAQTPPPPVGTTLAAGRPGSRHPISEAHPDRTQTHSVARESNPHGDSKISSAEGFTQEQLHESLATGRPRR
jgi:uncharacterized protein (DUF2267 family)